MPLLWRRGPGSAHLQSCLCGRHACVCWCVRLGDAHAPTPHHIVVDRCYVHGDDEVGSRTGVALNGQHLAVVSSFLSNFKAKGFDAQAVCGWGGAGPFKVVDCHLEATGENVMFGGADPKVECLVPSDITLCGNYFVKQLAWREQDWTVKNLLEFKNARRVLVAGNIMDYSWAAAQYGFAVLLTPRNQRLQLVAR